MRLATTLEEVYASLGGRSQLSVWTTAARRLGSTSISYREARSLMQVEEGPPVLLLLGTSWGLAPNIIEDSDALLEPIAADPPTDYNHLSVRAACAISLDRLLG